MRKYIIIMRNTNGTYYLSFEKGERKGTRDIKKAFKMTEEFANRIVNELNFTGVIDIAIA